MFKPFICKVLCSREMIFCSVLGVMIAMDAPVYSSTSSSPVWQPEASERLEKLPAKYIKKSLEQDFLGSELGSAVKDVGTELTFKSETLTDLEMAIKQTDGEMQRELKHQFLVEKREFVDLVTRKVELRRRALEKQSEILESLLQQSMQVSARLEGGRKDLIEKQNAARSRFQASISEVDMRLMEKTATDESKYSKEFTRNLSAIESLSQAIKNHAMSPVSEGDGRLLTKDGYLKELISETQFKLQLLDQEETILGYMAKLVALDANALSQEFDNSEYANGEAQKASTLPQAVRFFIAR